jgi:hypothetical protein
MAGSRAAQLQAAAGKGACGLRDRLFPVAGFVHTSPQRRDQFFQNKPVPLIVVYHPDAHTIEPRLAVPCEVGFRPLRNE